MDRLERQLRTLQETGEGLEQIYEETEKAVFLVAYSYLRDRGLAEDVRQDVYLRVREKAAQYRPGTNPKAWILTIARNLSLNLIKKRRECLVDFAENERLGGVAPDEGAGGLLIERAREILSAEQFQILYLVVVAGYKRREIAAYLEMPIGTVTWKYQESLKILRKAFKEEL